MDIHKKFLKLSPDAKILLIGHEPNLTKLISSIISSCDVTINLKKGGFVFIGITLSNSKIEPLSNVKRYLFKRMSKIMFL